MLLRLRHADNDADDSQRTGDCQGATRLAPLRLVVVVVVIGSHAEVVSDKAAIDSTSSTIQFASAVSFLPPVVVVVLLRR
jgi:hypothetical protein